VNTPSRIVLPPSNAGSVAHELARQAVDAGGAGLVNVLRLLLKRAEQIRTGEALAGDAGPDIVSEGLAQEALLRAT
jgi:hypothetical protein